MKLQVTLKVAANLSGAMSAQGKSLRQIPGSFQTELRSDPCCRRSQRLVDRMSDVDRTLEFEMVRLTVV